MSRVLEARKRYDQARVDAQKLVERHRAALGMEIHLARQAGTSQTQILVAMGKSREQVRAFENAWLRWHKEYPDDDPRR